MLAQRIRDRDAHIAVLGLGYVGLQTAVEFARAGFHVSGIDPDERRVGLVNQVAVSVSGISSAEVATLLRDGRLRATCQFGALAEADCVLICVPTPVTANQEPDLSFIESAARSIAARLHSGTLVVLESSCPPRTTRLVLLAALAASRGLQVGEDFFVAAAPERIDPGNLRFAIRNTPRVVGGITLQCSELTSLLFSAVANQVLRVSSPEVAEISKLMENTFRFLNVGFVNEMARVCDGLGISIWEVVDAAATKPFAFMPHYPGPGVGGRCIPVVPLFLKAMARKDGLLGELIDVACRINEEMPRFVVVKLERLLAERGKMLAGSRVLLLGMAYKADVSDTRSSSAVRVLELLMERDLFVEYYDPHVPRMECGGREIESLTLEELSRKRFDCAILLTAHSGVDYARIAERIDLLLDTRNHLVGLDGATVVPI